MVRQKISSLLTILRGRLRVGRKHEEDSTESSAHWGNVGPSVGLRSVCNVTRKPPGWRIVWYEGRFTLTLFQAVEFSEYQEYLIVSS